MSLLATSGKLTPSEAGFVLGRSPAVINKAVDEGVIEAKVVRRGATSARVLGSAEIRFLKLADTFRKDLTPAGRRKVYAALKGVKGDTMEVALGPMRFDLRRVDQDITARLHRLEAIKSGVDGHGSSEPVIRGTDVGVYVVAGLARGESVDEIAEDYPGLTRAQIEIAIDYATAYPKRGRPYPARSFKRALADLALHELPLERTRDGPRRIES